MPDPRPTIPVRMPPTSPRVREWLAALGGNHLVLTPDPAQCRSGIQTLLAIVAAREAVNRPGASMLWVGPDPDSARGRLERAFRAVSGGARVESRASIIRLGDSVIAVRDSTRAFRVPFDSLHLAVMEGIQDWDPEQYGLVRRRMTRDRLAIVAVGHEVGPEHWCRSAFPGEPFRVTWEDSVAAGLITRAAAEEARRVTPRAVFAVKWEAADQPMEVLSPGYGWSFRRFAALRLSIRTNTVPPQLIKFNVRPIQQRYLAMKRLGAARGHRLYILLKYRRGGFTTIEQGLSYRHTVSNREARCLTIAHADKDTRAIFQIALRYKDNDPDAPAIKGVGSETRLFFPRINSQYTIATVGQTAPSRGDTLDRVHGSEISKWCPGPRKFELIDDIMAGLTRAASGGEVVLESTPNGREWFWHTYNEAKAGRNAYWPIFLPWFADPVNVAAPGSFNPEEVYATATAEEKALVPRMVQGLTWDRVTPADRFSIDRVLARIAWRRRVILEISRRMFTQEYPEDDVTCFLQSGSGWFDTEKILALLNAVPDPDSFPESVISRRAIPGGFETIYERPIPGHRYCAGCDTSEGLPGSDPNGVGVVRQDSGAQVASIHGVFTPRELAEHCKRICTLYNNAFLGVEQNNHGHAVLMKLGDVGYAHPRVLFHMQPGRPGFQTNAVTRPQLLQVATDMVNAAPCPDGTVIVDRLFLGECLSFNKQQDGSYGADPGSHDDSVIKWAIAWMMRRVPRASLSLGEI